MSSSEINTCPFADIPFNGLFEDQWPKFRAEGATVVKMQKTGDTTAVIHDDPMSTAHTYGPNKLVVDLHQSGDTISPFPPDEVAVLAAGIGFNFEAGEPTSELLALLAKVTRTSES